jgi:Ca2+-binding RTX toxin-like protein
MTKVTAYNALGTGTGKFLSISGIIPSPNVTNANANFYGNNKLRVVYELNGGSYKLSANLDVLSQSKFRLKSMLLENAASQNLLKFTGMAVLLDLNKLQNTNLLTFAKSSWSSSDTVIATDFGDTIFPWAGNDVVYGNGGPDTVHGGSGNDLIFGGLDDDVLKGEDGNDKIYSGDGDDTGIGGPGKDKVYGGEGNDLLQGKKGSDKIYGGKGMDELQGDSGNDYMDGGLGDDDLKGGAGNDTLLGGDGNDSLRGALGKDQLNGAAGNDDLFGGGSNDTLKGNSGDDFISGGAGRDFISGGSGNDTIIGGADRDDMTGGAGNDTFALTAASESKAGQILRDIVRDFTVGEDLFDFSAIDATSAPSDQAFSFIGTAAFSGTEGELRYAKNTAKKITIVSGDIDGDGARDFQIEFKGLIDFTETDFIL